MYISRSRTSIQTNGATFLAIDHISFEDKMSGTEWWVSAYNLDETGTGARGYIRYHRVLQGVGPDYSSFTRSKTTSSNIIVQRMEQSIPTWNNNRKPAGFDGVAGYSTDYKTVEFYADGEYRSVVNKRQLVYPSGNGLLAYWRFEQASGNFQDTTANNRDVTRVGSVATGAGKLLNGALTVAGSSHALNAGGTGLSAGTGYTVAGWYKINNTAAAFQVLAQKGDASVNTLEWGIYYQKSNNTINLEMSSNGQVSGYSTLSTGWTPNGTYVFIVLKWDGTTLSFSANNGTAATVSKSAFFAGTANLYFGNNYTLTTYPLDGGVDEIGVWNRSLSVEEISTLYNSGNGLGYDTNTSGLDASRIPLAAEYSSLTNSYILQTSVGLQIDSGKRIGFGLAPTAALHLPAGTATASTAPLKFISGTNLTTPEAGAVEYDGSDFYGTDGTRREKFIRGYKGSGSPEGAVTAPVGSIYQRSDGSTNTSIYTKESGTGNTGWKGVGQTLTEQYNEVTSTTSPVTLSSAIADNLINQGGTQATFTLNLPASPVDGQVCTITYVNNITTLTLDGNGTTVIGSAVTTGVPGSQRKYKYYAAAGAWVKIY